MNFKFSFKKLMNTILAASVCILLTVPTVTEYACADDYEVWDGYTEDGKSNTEYSIFDLGNVSSIKAARAIPSRKHTADGNIFSAHWKNHLSNGNIWIKEFAHGTPNDWSDFDTIELKIYSEKATGATIMPVAYSPDNADGSVNYFMGMNFSVDWEGWKTISLDFSAASTPR